MLHHIWCSIIHLHHFTLFWCKLWRWIERDLTKYLVQNEKKNGEMVQGLEMTNQLQVVHMAEWHNQLINKKKK